MKQFWFCQEFLVKKSFLFHTRYQGLNFMKKANDNYVSYTGIVNRECVRFKLNELTADNFECLIFVQGLTAKRDSEIQSYVLSELEVDLKLTLQVVAKECEGSWI